MQTLLSKLKLKNKDKILNIDWNSTKEISKKIVGIHDNEEVIINGTEEFINKVHKELQNENLEGITVIDCYDFNEYKNHIKDILKEHETVLNTSGEKSKEEYLKQIAN